jgi:hypothetical protein
MASIRACAVPTGALVGELESTHLGVAVELLR